MDINVDERTIKNEEGTYILKERHGMQKDNTVIVKKDSLWGKLKTKFKSKKYKK